MDLNVIHITEAQVQVYHQMALRRKYTKFIDVKGLPEHVLFPMITGRCSDVLLD